MSTGRVRSRALGSDGTVVGSCDDNPMLNSFVYEFPDGQVKEHVANVITCREHAISSGLRGLQHDADGV